MIGRFYNWWKIKLNRFHWSKKKYYFSIDPIRWNQSEATSDPAPVFKENFCGRIIEQHGNGTEH